ncbi:hypothetical protein KM043_013885 [Ampulex compressa]|nr:hypothetical protein KM043_013885 [Ampulex compressa]
MNPLENTWCAMDDVATIFDLLMKSCSWYWDKINEGFQTYREEKMQRIHVRQACLSWYWSSSTNPLTGIGDIKEFSGGLAKIWWCTIMHVPHFFHTGNSTSSTSPGS